MTHNVKEYLQKHHVEQIKIGQSGAKVYIIVNLGRNIKRFRLAFVWPNSKWGDIFHTWFSEKDLI